MFTFVNIIHSRLHGVTQKWSNSQFLADNKTHLTYPAATYLTHKMEQEKQKMHV